MSWGNEGGATLCPFSNMNFVSSQAAHESSQKQKKKTGFHTANLQHNHGSATDFEVLL